MADFNDFFVASAGAAAALTGLIFVGVSINLKEIIRHKSLPTRASLALILLMAILLSAVVSLIHLNHQALGAVVTFFGFCLWLTLTIKDTAIYKNTAQRYRRTFLVSIVVDQIASIPYLAAGLFLLLNLECWIYFILFAYILSFIKSVWDAWVLIIEIMR